MALRSADDYVVGLRDGRRVHYQGKTISDVTSEPDLKVAIDHAALDFRLAHDPAHTDLTVSEIDGEPCSAYYAIPRNADDLLRRSKLIETVTAEGGTMVTLIKEIGSDAIFGLSRVLEGEPLERLQAFHRRCYEGDLAVAVAQTDTKGNRALPPTEQPDHYVRVVDRTSEGIVVRGAKSHTSVSVNSDELVVLPTRAMKDDAGDFAVAFAVPMDTEGLHLYVSNYGAGDKDPFSFPLSSRYKMLETLTVFDDVFVPWDRVFLDNDPSMAGPLASAFVEYHRYTAVSYKLPLIDAFVGAAAAIAEMNGVPRVAHVREKVTELMRYAETVRSLTELAAHRCDVSRGIARPDPLTTNLAKYTFATGYHSAIQLLQDCAGGLLVTGPGGDDWNDPETRAVLERYHSAAAPAEERLRMLNMIADLTARDFGGYHAVLAVHAEGSIEAEKRHLHQHYPLERTVDYAKKLAGLDG